MANGKIIQLKELDDLSTPIYPVTKADAVYLQNGSLLTDYLRGFPQTTIGAANKPIYLNNGVLTAGNEVYSKQEIDNLLNHNIYTVGADLGTSFANEASINTNSVTIQQAGFYLLVCHVQQCGGSSNGTGYWSAIPSTGSVYPQMIYGGIILNTAATWDASYYSTVIIQLNAGVNFSLKFTNHSGQATDSRYGSSVSAALLHLRN